MLFRSFLLPSSTKIKVFRVRPNFLDSAHVFQIVTVNSEIFARVLFSRNNMRSFVKIKPSQNGNITLSFTDVGKSCPCREFFTSQILTLFAKIKCSRKFLNLQYRHISSPRYNITPILIYNTLCLILEFLFILIGPPGMSVSQFIIQLSCK